MCPGPSCGYVGGQGGRIRQAGLLCFDVPLVSRDPEGRKCGRLVRIGRFGATRQQEYARTLAAIGFSEVRSDDAGESSAASARKLASVRHQRPRPDQRRGRAVHTTLQRPGLNHSIVPGWRIQVSPSSKVDTVLSRIKIATTLADGRTG